MRSKQDNLESLMYKCSALFISLSLSSKTPHNIESKQRSQNGLKGWAQGNIFTPRVGYCVEIVTSKSTLIVRLKQRTTFQWLRAHSKCVKLSDDCSNR